MPRKGRRGRLIVLEGVDGAGKSTVQRELLRRWRRSGLTVAGWKEPSSASLGKRATTAAPAAPSVAALYFTLDRLLARPALEGLLGKRRLVLQDRSFYSTLAYQGSALPPRQRRELEHIQRSVAIEPDLVVLLDVPVSIGLQRVGARNRRTSPIERSPMLPRVAREYRRLARRGHWLVVDARAPVEEVVQAIDRAVRGTRRVPSGRRSARTRG